MLGLTIGLATHKDLEILIFRGKGLPYQVVQHKGEDFVLNQFYAEATNTSKEDVGVQFNVEDSKSSVEILNSQGGFNVRAGKIERLGFFVRFPKSQAAEIAAKPLRVKFKSAEHEFVKEVRLVAPLTQ
jgi:hypothetical protein